MKVLLTYKILKAKAFNENIDETWVDWALEMMEAGYQSLYLITVPQQDEMPSLFIKFSRTIVKNKVLFFYNFAPTDTKNVLPSEGNAPGPG